MRKTRLPVSLNEATCTTTDKRLHHEQPADDREHDLVLDRDRDRAQQAAERERAGVAHEDLRRRRVEPKEADACADQRAADDDELAGVGNVVDAADSRE